jgi:hypothetical protein
VESANDADAALPVDFIDSPEAARELSAQGIDWVAGDPDMVLTTRFTPSGDAVWTAWSYGEAHDTPFIAPGP